jgi:outer membrane autotransporter protein
MASSYNKLTAEQVRANYHQQFFVADLQPPAGRNFNLGEGKVVQPYVRAAYVHEFAKNNEVKVNDNVFNNDLSGARGELGIRILRGMVLWDFLLDFSGRVQKTIDWLGN